MNAWGIAVYGNPCRECGFDWSISVEAAAALVAEIPGQYARLLEGQDGSARHPSLSWSVGAYVCHVGDNLRIWAERMWSSVEAGHVEIEAYDQDELAKVRRYESIPSATALWTLSHAVNAWQEAFRAAAGREPTFSHPERGLISLLDLVQSNCHDAVHHAWDIRRSLGV